MVRGPTRFTVAPIACSKRIFDRATREWIMSPHIAMRRPSSLPFARRIVRASNRACVGCSCDPSPALRTAQETFCDSRFTAPEDPCRTTSKSGFMAFSVTAVSTSVSPLLIEEAERFIFMTSAPSRLPASSNELWVRVELSKNKLI